MGFFVNRKRTGPRNNINVVEVTCSVANDPGVLRILYQHLGEGEGFDMPQDAARAAIDVIEAWQRDRPEMPLHLGFQPTEDCLPELFPYAKDAVDAEAKLLAHARDHWDHGPRCEQCDERMAGNIIVETLGGEDYQFCSQACADTYEDEYYDSLDDDFDEDAEEEEEPAF